MKNKSKSSEGKGIKIGKEYYYGVERLKVKCIEVGNDLSKFIDKNGIEYQFYNEDIYLTK
jgi:hypothetical protein